MCLYYRMAKARGWVFTLNNYTEEEAAAILVTDCKYVCYGREVGEEKKTQHLQGYIYFDNARSLRSVKRIIGDRAHLEIQRGSSAEAIAYCEKDGDFVERGERPNQGRRTDIWDVKKSIEEGHSELALYQMHFDVMIKYGKGFMRYRQLMNKLKIEKWTNVYVTVIWGDAGTGKTRKVMEMENDVYQVDNYPWFNGYNNQEAILFDDFYGGIKYCEMLRLLDGYPMQLNAKYGFTLKNWKKVYLTSNVHPDLWYTNVPNKDALKRRINKIIHL